MMKNKWRMPHPATMFLLLTMAVVFLSWICDIYGLKVTLPQTGEDIRVQSLLSPEGIRWWLRNAIKNFTGFAPLGMVIIAMFGLGVAQHSGFIDACIRMGVGNRQEKRKIVLWVIVLGLLSNAIGDGGYIILLPIAAMLFQWVGLHPIAGIVTAYFSVACGYSANIATLAETRTITLPDQTEIVLNRYSSLTYPERFRGKDRKVQLQGEAYFEVSKDAAHPFKVEAGAIIVQVLGTHFNVEAYPEDTQVKTTLLEGSVSVSLIGKAEESLILSPNESAIYNKDKKSLTLHTENNASEEIIWRNGTLLFKSIPLQEIVRQLSNAFHTDIRIEDADLQNYRMTATFSDGETLEEILSLLCRNQKFEYTKTNDIITITQKLN